jgi:TonB-dependent receptor
MYKILAVIFLFIYIIKPINALDLKGTVSDSITSDVLVGCSVYVPELKKGTTTGLDGSFLLKGISEGTYTIEIHYIGYKNLKQTIILGKSSSFLKFTLASESELINEITITSNANRSIESSARLTEKNALNIVNVMASRTIELSPDLNMASVIGRMSGVNMESNSSGEGQYAILRGMDKRYNYTLINGVKIPSTDNKYRYLPLDLFPSDLVECVEITKALTPDMEGDAIGGSVNLNMKDAPEHFTIKTNIASGYSQLFMERDFLSFNSSVINMKSPYEIYGSSYKATESNFPKANLDIIRKNFVPNIVAGISVGNRFWKQKLGFIISGSYSKTYHGTNSQYSSIGNTADETNLPMLKEYDERRYNDEHTQYGIHNKIDFRLNAKNTFKLYTVYINMENKQVRDLTAIDFSSYTPGNGYYTKNYETRNRLNIQSIFNTTLQGNNQINKHLSLNWSGVYSVAGNQSPDNTKIKLVSDVTNYSEQHIYVTEKSCYRRWTRNSDTDMAGYFDLDYHSDIYSQPLKLSIGGLYRDKQRTSFFNQYTIIPVSERAAPYSNFSEKGVEWDSYSQINWTIVNPPDPTDPLNYDATENIFAGYFKFDLKINKLKLLGGLRAEHTKQGYILHFEQYGSNPIGNQDYTDFLPSIHFKYSLKENQNLRLSYFRAVNRPGFLEIVPYESESDDYPEYSESGNSDLKHAVADNVDFRYEYFHEPLDQFMAGVFYKAIHNPIEYCFEIIGSSGNIYYMPDNFGTAINYGAEIDASKFFRNFGIRFNYTWTHSNITTSKLLLVRDENANLVKTLVNQKRPLVGQAEHMANLSLLYKNTRIGLDAQLAASYTSNNIAIVSQYLDNDIWEKGKISLDCSAEKKLNSWISLFVKANNLLDSPREQFVKKVNPEYVGYPGQSADSKVTQKRKDYYRASYLLGFRMNLN